ncbi:unnamed protein product [Brachionus calyciflorus]|uniref:Ty3 transposon capsid-like protein domain-containing protein n=1 Tax=Brachionus calyciflorus TaxID=104777 RepID=A0A814QQY0_9BILA|nr:unnamed protein product [Brachionus calyciflorus]
MQSDSKLSPKQDKKSAIISEATRLIKSFSLYEEPKTIVTPTAPPEMRNKPLSILKNNNYLSNDNQLTNNSPIRSDSYISYPGTSQNNQDDKGEPKIQGKLETTSNTQEFIIPKSDSTMDLVKFVADLAGNNKTKRLDPNTKKFSGSNSEDVDDWLFNVEQGFIASKIREEEKLNSVLNFVDKVPSQILRKHITSFSTWSLFEKELRNTYTKINKDYWVRSQLSTLKHRENMAFENYVNRFYMLTNMLPKMDDDEKLFLFIEGLKDMTKKEVTCRNLKTLSETINLAKQLEQAQTGIANINYINHNKNAKKGHFNYRNGPKIIQMT